MKKVCFLCPKVYPLFNEKCSAPFGGGAEVQMYILAKELSSYADIKVSFVVADEGQCSKETFGSIDVFKSLRFKDAILGKIMNFHKAMKMADADLYIQSTLNPFSGAMALLCRLKGKKFVYRVASDSEVDGRYEREKGAFIGYLSKIVFKFSDLVIVQNTSQRDAISQRKVKNVLLLRSGVDIANSAVQKEDFVLWVGRSVEMKRPELFIQLAKQMPEIRFVMILSGDPDSKLHQLIKSQCKGAPNLELHESMPFREAERYFQKAKVFVSTSEMEGFPMVFLQAAANRTPIVSLSVDPDGILSEKRCGLFSGGNISLLKKQINEVLHDGNLYRELGENGYNFVKENCPVTRIAKQLYESIIKL
ncbi:MAG: glycosyltransferase family 4 protein [Candidatus Omnitrophica bacterium]|nr:glycosyltransferase family 4 protein [Candidatus Omnitrophota bacterium]